MRLPSVATVIAALVLAAPARAEEIGECRFDRDRLTFAGTPVEQAACLLRRIKPLGVREALALPPVIRGLLESATGPSGAQLAAALAALPQPYRGYAISRADAPVSETTAGLPLAYFVIHDTSTPFFGNDPFPDDLNLDPLVNDFTPYVVPEPVAHIFLNRMGQIWAGHDFAEPWRATKLESYVIGVPARGRFVHIETVQPRRFLPGAIGRGQTEGPVPGFTHAQYRMLAALYVYVSARAGHWLIPAQHNTVDSGIPDAHDDPQNFELQQFAAELEKLVAAVPR